MSELCTALPAEEQACAAVGSNQQVFMPLEVTPTLLPIIVDFVTRAYNVRCRPASLDLAWRKSIEPRIESLELDGERVRHGLLLASRALGCASLRKLCGEDVDDSEMPPAKRARAAAALGLELSVDELIARAGQDDTG